MLNGSDRLLSLEAALFLLISHWALRLLGFPRLISTIGSGESRAPDPRLVQRIAAAVNRSGDRLGYTCLRRALAAAWMLRVRGIKPTLRYGVNRIGGTMRAHAWLEVRGMAVVGQDQAHQFALLETFPRRR